MAEPRRRYSADSAIIEAVSAWSRDFVEQAHPVFGGLPVCPFARAARLRRGIRFEVLGFSVGDPLHTDGTLLRLIGDTAADPTWETLFVIHPDPQAMTARQLEAFVVRLNRRLAALPALAGLCAFEAHPRSRFSVGGVYTRRSPYPSVQILSYALLKSSSDTLRASGYYDRFTPEMLRAVGMPRD